MSQRHDIRRLAMQVLYQLDLRGEADTLAIRQSLADGPDPQSMHEPAFTLALAAWQRRDDADTLATDLAPQWPTHRQPPVDRAILRLAYHEMASGITPVKVAINEAVELAKQYSSENSWAFVNGVLDKMAKRIGPPPERAQGLGPREEATPGSPAAAPDAWLRDAIKDVPPQDKEAQ